MRFLLVLYRWGADLLGGAETYHRRLAMELRDLGHEVEVWTTTAHESRPFCHWGRLTTSRRPAGVTEDEGITVRRFPALELSPAILGANAKLLQHWHDTHPARVPDDELAAGGAGVVLGHGWNPPEMPGADGVRRWTTARAAVHCVGAGGMLEIDAEAPRGGAWRIEGPGGAVLARGRIAAGRGTLAAEVPGGAGRVVTVELVVSATRPLRDFRQLGVLVRGARLVPRGGGAMAADLQRDALGLAGEGTLWAHAAARPWWAGRVFDALRGPTSPALQRALAAEPRRRDAIVSGNFPWRVPMPPRVGEGGATRVLLPLFHPRDPYYYWEHYRAAMRDADLVMAATPHDADVFLPALGARGVLVGPAIWPREGAGDGCAATPRGAGGPMRVFTLSRKVPEKRYGDIVASVARLRARGVAVELEGAGPDDDGCPLGGDGARWLGAVDDAALVAAWARADVFALMSESESFGMVIVEAWHEGLPVVVNRRCAATASLVRDGVDGLVAAPGEELDAALERLARDEHLRRKLGEEGRARARREFKRGSAGKRLADAVGEGRGQRPETR